MARQYKSLESLTKAIERKEAQYEKAKADSLRQCNNVGFGAGMRYSKLPSCGFTKENRIRDELKELYCQLDELKALVEPKKQENFLIFKSVDLAYTVENNTLLCTPIFTDGSFDKEDLSEVESLDGIKNKSLFLDNINSTFGTHFIIANKMSRSRLDYMVA